MATNILLKHGGKTSEGLKAEEKGCLSTTGRDRAAGDFKLQSEVQFGFRGILQTSKDIQEIYGHMEGNREAVATRIRKLFPVDPTAAGAFSVYLYSPRAFHPGYCSSSSASVSSL